MDGWAFLIADSIDFRALWAGIVDGIVECRKWYARFRKPLTLECITPHSQQERSKWHNKLQSQALDIARAYVEGIRNDNVRRLIEHEEEPQQIRLRRLCLIEEKLPAPQRSFFSKRLYLTILPCFVSLWLTRCLCVAKTYSPGPYITHAEIAVLETARPAGSPERKIISGPHVFDTRLHEDIAL